MQAPMDSNDGKRPSTDLSVLSKKSFSAERISTVDPDDRHLHDLLLHHLGFVTHVPPGPILYGSDNGPVDVGSVITSGW